MIVIILGIVIVVQLGILIGNQRRQAMLLTLMKQKIDKLVPGELESKKTLIGEDRELYEKFIKEDFMRAELPPKERFDQFRIWKATLA